VGFLCFSLPLVKYTVSLVLVTFRPLDDCVFLVNLRLQVRVLFLEDADVLFESFYGLLLDPHRMVGLDVSLTVGANIRKSLLGSRS
jgi:hypothetical protein